MKKSLFLSLALMLSTALWALNNVEYIDANGKIQHANNVTEVTNSDTTVTWNAGWYVINGANVTLSQGAICHGAVHLILADNSSATITGANGKSGICIEDDKTSITIYGQTDQSGILNAKGDAWGAGIGYSHITINGGNVTATAGGNRAAGIGGSYITINGGKVTARSICSGAAIGGCDLMDGTNITINGGVVDALVDGGVKKYSEAAAIGGGFMGQGCNITINGGKVSACSDYTYAAAIGGGHSGNGHDITFNGGEVTASAWGISMEIQVNSIGGGYRGSSSKIYANVTLLVELGSNIEHSTTTDISSKLCYEGIVRIKPNPNPVVEEPFIDKTSGLKFEITSLSNTLNTIKLTPYSGTAGGYTGSSYTVPSSVLYRGKTFLVTSISNNAFQNCTKIKDIYLPWAESGDMPALGNNVFSGLASNVAVHIPFNTYDFYKSLNKWKDYNFYVADNPEIGYVFMKEDNKYEVASVGDHYTVRVLDIPASNNDTLAVPATVIFDGKTYEVAYVGDTAFKHNTHIKTLVMSRETPPELDSDVLAQMTNLTSIYVPFGYLNDYQIAEGWNVYAEKIHTVSFEIGTQFAIGNYRYEITEMNQTSNLLKVVEYVNNNVEKDTIPTSLHREGINFAINEIGSNAFNGKKISSLIIPTSITKIAASGLAGLSTSEITVGWSDASLIPSGANLGTNAFANLNKAVVHIPFLSYDTYKSLAQWKDLNLVANNPEIGYCFSTAGINYVVTSVDKTYTVEVGDNRRNDNIAVSIPSSVVFDGKTYSVTSISDYAFDGAVDLSTVTMACTTPPTLGVTPFINTALTIIQVPIASVDAYKTAWSAYANKIGFSYVDEVGVSHYLTKVSKVQSSDQPVMWTEGWYAVFGNVILSQGAICNGNVRLILVDGAVLTVSAPDNKAAIEVSGEGNSFTVYGHTKQTGKLVATGGKNAAGIGGSQGQCGSTITFAGGNISAIGGENAPGIGSGANGLRNSHVYVADNYQIKTGVKADSMVLVEHRDITQNVANNLAFNQYATIAPYTAVKYIGSKGEILNCTNYKQVKASSSAVTWNAGWYVVSGSITLSKGAICKGGVHLILMDGAKLTLKARPDHAAIEVSSDNDSLFVYGQTKQTGQLKASGYGSAGIGGVDGGSCFNITINGGIVTATGGEYAAGIGGSGKGSCSNITINGGTVTAKGGYCAAGIGGGSESSCFNITINGGTVTAGGGEHGPGIGGGSGSAAENITINDGVVTAKGGLWGAGIGGGHWGSCSNITIAGGKVTAACGKGAAGIGAGQEGSCENVNITGGVVIATAADGTSAINVSKRVMVSNALTIKAENETINHNSDEDITTKLKDIKSIKIYSSLTVTYGENITVKPAIKSGDEVEGGTQITFTAKNRELEGYGLVGFFSDAVCQNAITVGVSGLTYATHVNNQPLSVYAKYEKKYPSVTFGSYLTVNPELQSGDTIEGGTKVTFTATDRWAEGYDLIGFFSDSDCKNAITEGVSGLTYTTTVGINPVAVYVMYKLVRVDVACDEHFIISPALTRGMADIGSQVTFTAIDRTKDNYKFKGLFADSTYQQPLTEGVSGQTYTTTIPKFPISVYAKYVEYVSADYVDADGEHKTCPKAYIVTSSAFPEIWDEEWYIVRDADVQLEQGAFCRGDVHLILADGAKLVATGRKGSYADKIPYSAGIEVSGGQCSLTIYGQLEQTGKLEAEGTLFGAGIGGGERQANDPITINGGNIKATGNTGAAGIGGGSGAEGKNITINGGKVRALGGWRNVMGEVESGAGIGGGTETDGHDITINGGEVTASGAYTNNGPAAIGGGYKGNGYNITITGGTVVADGQKAGAGIGGGAKGYGYDISILGGTVMANGGAGASAIGWGKGGESQWDNKNLYVADGYFIRADNTTPPTTFIDYTSGEDLMPKVGGKQYVVIGLDTLPVLREGAIAAVQDSAEVVENAIATLGLKDESLARSKQVVADIVDTATARITAAWKQEPILLAQQTAYEALDARWQYDLAFAPIEKARTEAGRALDDSVAKAKTWIENASIEDRYKEGPLSKIDYVYNHNVDNVLWGKTFEEIDYWTQRAFAELAVQVQEFLAVVAQFEQDKLAAIATIDSTAEQARLTIEAIPSDITGQYYKNWAYDELANTVNEYTALINESDNPAYVTSRKNLAISAINTTLKSAKSSLDKYISLKIEKEAVMLTIQDSADRTKLIVPTVTDDESIKAASITAIDAIVSSSASSLAAAKSSNTLNTILQNAFSAFANQIQTLYQDAAFAVKKAEAISYINKVSETAIAEINNAGEGDYLRDLKDEYISQVTKKARTSITYINKATVQHDIDYWTEQMDTEISNILPSALNAIHAAVVLHDAQALALSQMEDSLASAKTIVEACVIEQVVKDRAVKSMESVFVLCKKAILNNPIDTAAVMREKGTCLNEIFYQVMFVLRSAAELAAAQSEDLTAIQDSATSAKALINAAIVADTVKTSALTTIDTTVTKAVNTIEKALALHQFSTVKDPVLSTIGEQVKLVKAHASTLSYEKRLAIDYIEGRERTVISAVNAASRADYVQPIQQAAIDEMNATATQAINGINASFIREDILVIRNTTGTSLEAIKTQALATIRAAVALHENQAQALKDITASVDNAKAQISLAKVEELIKTDAATAIDNATATATDAIGVATTLEAISEARQTALTVIAEQVELVQNADAQLEQVRSEAQDAIYHAANAAIVAINGAEADEYAQPIKEQAITSISETEVSATDAITEALTMAAVTTTKEEALTMIETIKTQALKDIAALVSLTQAQAQAVSAVQDSALIVKEQMEALDLSDSVRTAYLSSIDSTVVAATDAIYKTSTLAEVATAQQSAFAALATQWQTISETYQDQLAQAKSEGIAAINGAKTSAIEAITNTASLEQVLPVKQAAIDSISTIATDAVGEIEETELISEVELIEVGALDMIDMVKEQAMNIIRSAIYLYGEQTSALASIQDAATNAKALIQAAIVEQIIKTSALMSIDETVTNATTTIEAATTVAEVQTIEQTTLTTIQTLLQSVLDTDAKAKNNAIAAITKAKDDAYYELLYSANSADVATIKQTAMEAVVSTAADSVAAIKAVTAVEAILPIQEGAIASINTIKEEALALILAVPTLFDAQQEALTAIQDSATNAKAVIENLVVNTELKTPATLAISDAYSEAYNAITMAGTVVAVHAAKQTAFAAYGAQVQKVKDAATELAQAKSEAIAAINAAAEQARTNINSASSEDYVQSIKDAALDELAYSVSYSTKGINNNLYVSIIPSLKTNGLNGIKNIETQALADIEAAVALHDAKDAAAMTVTDSATFAKGLVAHEVIDNPTKTQAVAAIEAALAIALTDIPTAETLQAIETIKQTAMDVFSTQVQTVKDAATELAQAKTTYIATIQNKAAETIAEIRNASDEDCARSIQDNAAKTINSLVRMGEIDINAAMTVNDVVGIWFDVVDPAISAVKTQALTNIATTVLNHTREMSMKAVQDSANSATTIIENAIAIQTVKDEALAAIQTIVETAINAIQMADVAELMQTAVTTAFAAIDEQVVIVRREAGVLAEAKSSALKDINDAIATAKLVITSSGGDIDYIQPIKDAALASLEQVTAKVPEDINSAMDTETITTIKDRAITEIDAIRDKAVEDITTLIELTQERVTLLNKVKSQADMSKNVINQTEVSSSIKTMAVTAIDNALATALTDMEAAELLSELTNAYNTAVAIFEAQVQAVTDAAAKEAQEKAALANAKTQALAAIQSAVTSAKQAITQAAIGYEYEAKEITEPAFALITTTDSTASAGIQTALTIAAIAPIKEQALTSIESTKTQAVEEINALIASILAKQAVLQEAKDAAKVQVQDSAANAFEAVKYLFVTPNVIYKAQEDLDNAETTALTVINHCPTIEDIDGEVEFAFARFAEIVAEAKSMEGGEETKIVPLYGTETTVAPTEEDVTITWPVYEEAESYTLIITEEGDTIYEIKFDTDGVRVGAPRRAPSMDGVNLAPAADLTMQGYQYTVSGLTTQTHYGYKVISQTVDNTVIYQNGGGFMTSTDPTPTGINTLPYEGKEGKGSFKVMENHRFFIIRDGKRYTMMGVGE